MGRLSFLGATGTVTGSKFLVEHDGFRLLVDCGLFQGLKELRLRNWQPLPVPPSSVDTVALTHAHLDHTGYLPRLVKTGYAGPVLATSATADLCGILLPDSGHLQEEDARFANKHGHSKHRPALPLYTELEARQSLARLRPVPFDRSLEIRNGLELRYRPAGHILGAAFLEVRVADKIVIFSGDLGRPHQPMLPGPWSLPPCDQLVLESTYGNRDHPTEDPKLRLEQVIRETTERGGVLVIPAFAVGRTTELLYLLQQLDLEDRLPPDIPIHVDSPMAVHAIRVFLEHKEAQHPATQALVARKGDPLGLRNVHLVTSVPESKALNDTNRPAIIISASGMATGGRIVHHLAHRLPDPRTTVLLVGYQAAGTRGRALQEGARQVRIHGSEVPVRARIDTLASLSAHADRGEILAWLKTAKRLPSRIHLVHGEQDARVALAERIREELGIDVHLPEYQEQVSI